MNKKIGIVAATQMELAPVLNKDLPANIKTCVTGIGTVATTYNLLLFIQNEKPDFLIQAGIAGCFNKKVPLSSFYVIEKDCFADLGVMDNNEWIDMFDLGLIGKDSNPYEDSWLINKTKTSIFKNENRATGITVNEITTAASKNNSWLNKYEATLESLEGAAFHYVCLMQGIPFLQVRTVSNYVGERDKNNWEIEKAILHLNKKLHDVVGNLQNEDML